jgi:hypothetical protein
MEKNTFTNADGTSSSIDEPSTFLHLGDEFLVEHTLRLLMKRTIDCDDISLTEHLFKRLDTTTADFLLCLSTEGLIIKVEKFFTVEGNKTSQDTFTDTPDTDGGNDFAFDIE